MKMKKGTSGIILVAGLALLLFVTFKSGIFNTEKDDSFKDYIEQKENETKTLEESDLIPLIGQYGKIKATANKTAASRRYSSSYREKTPMAKYKTESIPAPTSNFRRN